MTLLRYDKTYLIGTDLDPIEDLLIFIKMLKSSGVTSDILREKHGFTNASEIKKTSKLISLHVENAIGLAEQAFDGPAESSYLSLYYSTLNLSKVHLLFLGKRIELQSNKWHGARYEENQMKKLFLNEEIKISNRGTIPLIYNSVLNKSIPRDGYTLKLSELYSKI